MELYPGIVDKAVRLGYGLITNHPFVDGNKRIDTHAMLVLKKKSDSEIADILGYNSKQAVQYKRSKVEAKLREVMKPRVE